MTDRDGYAWVICEQDHATSVSFVSPARPALIAGRAFAPFTGSSPSPNPPPRKADGMTTKYPGGMTDKVPTFNAANRTYVEESNAMPTTHTPCDHRWFTDGCTTASVDATEAFLKRLVDEAHTVCGLNAREASIIERWQADARAILRAVAG